MSESILEKIAITFVACIGLFFLIFPGFAIYKAAHKNQEQHKVDTTPHEIVCDNPLIGERRAGAPTRFFWDSNGHIRNKENTIHFVPMQGDICEVRADEPIPMEDLIPLLPDTGSYAAGPENG